MHSDKELFTYHMSRRGLLAASGAVGAGLAAGVLVADPAVAAAPRAAGAASAPADLALGTATTDPVTTPRVAGLHTQFGSDASREVVVSWHTLQPVTGARVLLGGADGRFLRTFHADPVSYVDGKSGQTVYAQHAHIGTSTPRPTTSTSRCTPAPSRSTARSPPAPAGAPRSPSPASATRARPPPASVSCRRPE